MGKQPISKTHYVEEERGLYYCRCGKPECGNCGYGDVPTRDEAQAQADDLNRMEAICQDIAEEVNRMAKDYSVPVEEVIAYFDSRAFWWLRDMVKKVK